jgi:hypothetical protein
VTFRITHHSGYNAPPDALDTLLVQLGPRRDTVAFSKDSDEEITAVWEADLSSSMTQDERTETGRRMILEIVRDVCDVTPALDVDWFAISKMPESHERVSGW